MMIEEIEKIAKDVVDCSMKLHMDLGPGLLESVYTIILQKKLQDRGYRVEREVECPSTTMTSPLIWDSVPTSSSTSALSLS